MSYVSTAGPLHHVTVVRRFSDTAAHFSAPVLILSDADGKVATCVPLIEYFRAHKRMSHSWQNDHARAMGLFWDFCVVHAELEWQPYQLLREFALALNEGTVGARCDSVRSRLMWPALSLSRARRLIECVEAVAFWFSSRGDVPIDGNWRAGELNPRTFEGVRNIIVWARMRNLSILKHIKRGARTSKPSLVKIRSSIGAGKELDPISHFPATYAERLLWEGHKRTRCGVGSNVFDQYNVRDIMMALLNGWGGLRRSEGLHLWTSDVLEDPTAPGHALVILNHPEEGPAEYRNSITGMMERKRRKNALEVLYGLKARNVVMRGHYHAGWKGMALNGANQSTVFWLDEQASALFLVLYEGYMRFVRPRVMARRRAMGGADHPFLFVSEVVNSITGLPGEPYSQKAYERNHKAAVLRLGLPCEKKRGTTGHGLRHLFGQSLSNLGVPPEGIRAAMRHMSMTSQLVYTRPSAERTNEILQRAHQRSKNEVTVSAALTSTTTDELLQLRQFSQFGGGFD